MLLVIQDGRITTAEFPGVKKGRPVDVVDDFLERQIVDDWYARDSGLGDIDRLPIGDEMTAARFL